MMNKTVTKPRNRERRTRPVMTEYTKVTLYISPAECAVLQELMEKGGYTREEIFLHGMYDMMH